MDSWIRISTAMDIPIEELKRKRDSLKASYRAYRRKIRKSALSGAHDVYKPTWFAYDYMDSFLGDGLDYTRTTNAEEDTEEIIYEVEVKQENSRKRSNIKTPSKRGSHRRFNPPKQPSSKKVVRQRFNPLDQTESKRVSHRRHKAPELQPATKQMDEAFNALNKIISDATNEDDCDIFGRLIGKKLKKVPDDKRDNLMIDIQRLIQNYLPTNTVTYNGPATNTSFSHPLQRNSSSFVKHKHSGLISTNSTLSQKRPSPVLVLNNNEIIKQALLEALQI